MDDYVIDGDLVFSNKSSALKFYREQYHKKKEWVGLTDDEIKEIVGPWGSLPVDGYTRKLFDQIEAKLKEKNT